MTILARTRAGLLVPEQLADEGTPPPGISRAEWRTLSTRDRGFFDRLPAGKISGGGSPATYMVVNGPMPTTAAPTSVTTGTAIKTLLQVKPGLEMRVIEWGISFDGSAAATPGKVELLEVDVAATVTAYAAADVMVWGNIAAAANTAGTSGIPLNLGTTHSGYTSSGEGTPTASRMLDPQLIAGTNQYVKPFSQNREPDLTVAKFTRIRVTFAAAINAYCYIIFEV